MTPSMRIEPNVPGEEYAIDAGSGRSIVVDNEITEMSKPLAKTVTIRGGVHDHCRHSLPAATEHDIGRITASSSWSSADKVPPRPRLLVAGARAPPISHLLPVSR